MTTKEHKNQVKDVIHCRLQRRYNVMEGIDVDIFHSEVVHFSRISHFGQESGRVLGLRIRLGLGHCSFYLLYYMHQQRVDNIYLTIRLPPPRR